MKRTIALTIVVIVVLAIASYAYIQLIYPQQKSTIGISTTGTGTTSTSPTGGQPAYNLAIFMTDPPIVPPNVTAVYLSYKDIMIHKIEGDDWISLNQSGEIELMGLVNFTQIISLAKLPTGNYNLLRFTNSSAIVTYEGKNYTAKIPSDEVLVRIEPPLTINSSATTGLMIDLSPKVILVPGNDTCFMLVPYAKAFQINDLKMIIKNEKLEELFRMRSKILINNTFIISKLITLSEFVKVQILNVTINENGFNVTIKNISNTSVDLKLLILSARIPFSIPIIQANLFPNLMHMVFKITQNGSLELLSNVNSTILMEIMNGTGLKLQPNAIAILSYHGPMKFNYVIKYKDGKVMKEIIEFQKKFMYVITIIGDPQVYVRAIVLVK